MNDDENAKNADKPTKRYLMEVRGVLHVDAENAHAAREAVRKWIAAASESSNVFGDAEKETPHIRVGYLKSFPDD